LTKGKVVPCRKGLLSILPFVMKNLTENCPSGEKKIGEVKGNKVTLFKGSQQNLYMFLIHILKEPFRLKN
jgi:hypothetical protein